MWADFGYIVRVPPGFVNSHIASSDSATPIVDREPPRWRRRKKLASYLASPTQLGLDL